MLASALKPCRGVCLWCAVIVTLSLCVNTVAVLCCHSRTVLSCAALFSLCSHQPQLSPPISPDSYLSVITDLKTAQTLSITTHTRTYTQAQTALAESCIAKWFCTCASSNLITCFHHARCYEDKYLIGMWCDWGQFRRIFIMCINPVLNGLVQVATWSPPYGYSLKVSSSELSLI